MSEIQWRKLADPTKHFLLDGHSVVQEMQGGAVTATYLTGLRGPECRIAANGDATWYIFDGLGSVVGEANGSGTVTAVTNLDVYGLVRSQTGTSTSKHKFVGNLGHTSEGETGLVYMRARYYDPVLGRFISEDPGRDGQNWFVYCRNNPVNLVDHSGKDAARVLEIMGYIAMGIVTMMEFLGIANVRQLAQVLPPLILGAVAVFDLGLAMGIGTAVVAAAPYIALGLFVVLVALIVIGLICGSMDKPEAEPRPVPNLMEGYSTA